MATSTQTPQSVEADLEKNISKAMEVVEAATTNISSDKGVDAPAVAANDKPVNMNSNSRSGDGGSSNVNAGGGNQKYNLRWHDYPQTVVNSFRNLKEEEDFVDVTLACNSQQFTAHKVVLSACSPYFKKLLKVRGLSLDFSAR